MTKFTQNDILKFLNSMSKQSKMPLNTVNTQKAAVIKVSGVLDENERNNLTEDLNIEDLLRRFETKSKHELSGDSLRTYSARFKSAFHGFLAWNKDPSNYKPKSRRGRPVKPSSDKAKIVSTDSNTSQASLSPSLSSQINANLLVKYPLITNTIRGSLELPEKLSKSESDRLIPLVVEIIKAHSKDDSILNKAEEITNDKLDTNY